MFRFYLYKFAQRGQHWGKRFPEMYGAGKRDAGKRRASRDENWEKSI